MVRQLGVDQRHLDLPLAQFLDAETAHLSKTVVVILDQFEEFFLRLPLEVRGCSTRNWERVWPRRTSTCTLSLL
jgi:hypothetical protein